ncbi:hypothetical protein M422DRAFT_139174, partial [Sphaerobolus stellatus SS14]
TLKYMNQWQFQLAVDTLESLVVQRLFELTKANASRTGMIFNQYSLYAHHKAIKSRSKACQRALCAYNLAAAKLDPRHPQLEWSDIVEYTTLAEFEILRIAAREDIRNLEWANVRNRQATVCHLKIKRAKEEIIRLNVEIKRVLTWINDENELFSSFLEKTTDPLLYNALLERALERERVNNKLEAAVARISLLKGFTGQIS